MRACDFNVYRITYGTMLSVFAPNGFGEMERTGEPDVAATREYLCVAPTEAFARTAFDRYHSRDTFVKIENVGALSDIVLLQ